MRRAVPVDQTRLDLLPARLPRNLPYYLSVDVPLYPGAMKSTLSKMATVSL